MNLLKLIAAGIVFTSFNCLHAMEMVQRLQAESEAKNFQNLSEEQQMAVDYKIFKEVISSSENKMLAMTEEVKDFIDSIYKKTYRMDNEHFEEILQRYDSLYSEIKISYSENFVTEKEEERRRDLGTLFGEELGRKSGSSLKRVNGEEIFFRGLYPSGMDFSTSANSRISKNEAAKLMDECVVKQFKCWNYTMATTRNFTRFEKILGAFKKVKESVEQQNETTMSYLKITSRNTVLMLQTHIKRTENLIAKIEGHFGIYPRVEITE